MAQFLIKWFVNIAALLVVTGIVPGIKVDSWQTAVIAALVLGLLNAFLRPLLLLLTLPLNILSLGIFTFVINALMFYWASQLVPGFHIISFGSAFFGALFFSFTSFFLNLFITAPGKVNVAVSRKTRRPKYEKSNVIDVEGKVVSDEKKNRTGEQNHS